MESLNEKIDLSARELSDAALEEATGGCWGCVQLFKAAMEDAGKTVLHGIANAANSLADAI